MKLQLKIYQAGCGDAISIGFIGKSGAVRRVWVDSGYVTTYSRILFRVFRDEIPEGQQIDLWVLTHLDADHINGAYKYICTAGKGLRAKLLHTLWFNFFGDFNLAPDTEQVGYTNAIKLRDALSGIGCSGVLREVTNEMAPYDLDGAIVTVLSPDRAAYRQLERDWVIEEDAYRQKMMSGQAGSELYDDDKTTIAELAAIVDRTENMRDTTNRSSIAFLLEYGGCSLLMLGDAFPSIIMAALRELLAQRRVEKLKVDFVKLAHHGSINNFNGEMMELIDCENYIICSNGINGHKLPNKEVLAKIIAGRPVDRPLRFYFNYESSRYDHLFDVDAEALAGRDFKCIFPERIEPYLAIPHE